MIQSRLFVAIAAVLALLAAPAIAQSNPRFDPGRLDRQEVRFVQAALVFAEAYAGPVDGIWGRDTERALRRSLGPRPRADDLAALIDPFRREVDRNGWRVLNLDIGVTITAPMDLTLEDRSERFRTWRTRSNDLSWRILTGSADNAEVLHAQIFSRHRGDDDPFRATPRGGEITAARLADGQTTYLRTWYRPGIAVSLQAFADDTQQARLALLSATMADGRAPALSIPRGGYLDRLLTGGRGIGRDDDDDDDRGDRRDDDDDDRDDDRPAEVGLRGTGFYVNGTDILSAYAVLDGCRNPRLSDGTRLTVLARDERTGLALMTSPQRSRSYIPVDARGLTRGDAVTVLGQPGVHDRGSGLVVFQGSYRDVGHGTGVVEIGVETSLRPVTRGGPVLNIYGDATGVLLTRRSNESQSDRRTGFVAPAQAVQAFLAENRSVTARPDPSDDLSRGVPASVRRAVVGIHCG